MTTEEKEFKVNPNRELIIVTWGNRINKSKPIESERNFNVCSISDGKRTTETGMDEDVRRSIVQCSQAQRIIQSILRIVEEQNLHIISINCHKGRHRSVSVANHLIETYYRKGRAVHKCLNGKIFKVAY